MKPTGDQAESLPNSRDWVELGDYVFDLVKKKMMDSNEFKLLIQVYGKEKLRTLYEQARDRRREAL